MNKAITDGLILMPPPFSAGLDQWSSGDGTPGSDTYDGAGAGAFVPADANFAGCLEFVTQGAVQKVRSMTQTPVLPGCYLRVTARVKCLSGPLPSVRVAGWAGDAADQPVAGAVTEAAAVPLSAYGAVTEVTAILGTGIRTGVEMTWAGAAYGHLGIDIVGAAGSVIRVDDIEVEDVTGVFLRDMLGLVDVRDYGAVGDGVADDAAAFEAADADAGGRAVLVSAGTFRIGSNVTFQNEVKFEGTVVADPAAQLILQRNFDYPTYLDAFGDEEEAFRKAVQALFNFTDHESLDLGGRRIELTAPVDVQSAVGNKSTFAVRRVIRNGQLEPTAGPAWDKGEVIEAANYSAADPLRLTAFDSLAGIEVGALVEGGGVGREVYVTEIDLPGNAVTLSQPLHGPAARQSYSFTRFRYLLDFSGWTSLSQFVLTDMEFRCEGVANGILLPPAGLAFQVKDSLFNKPKDRAITSHGRGCQGLMVDRCQFLSDEQAADAGLRQSVALNINANDAKLRDNRAAKFRHWAVIGGRGTLMTGNHVFQGDEAVPGVRVAGIVLATANVKSVLTGNYIDNCFVEWTNEYEADPDFANQFSFGGLTVTGNIFTTLDAAPWTRFLVVRPFGNGHFVHGLSVTGNVFRAVGGDIDRIEGVDAGLAPLDLGRMRNIVFAANTFNAVTEPVANPVSLLHAEPAPADPWIVEAAGPLPFAGRARAVEAVVPMAPLTDGSAAVHATPHVTVEDGPAQTDIRLDWGGPVTGEVRLSVRMDTPH